MVGEFPGLTKLDENENLVNTSDFRAMYAALLGQWFQTEAGLVIPGAGTGLAGPSAYGHGPPAVRLMGAARAAHLGAAARRPVRARLPRRSPPSPVAGARGRTAPPTARRGARRIARAQLRARTRAHAHGATPARRARARARAGTRAERHHAGGRVSGRPALRGRRLAEHAAGGADRRLAPAARPRRRAPAGTGGTGSRAAAVGPARAGHRRRVPLHALAHDRARGQGGPRVRQQRPGRTQPQRRLGRRARSPASFANTPSERRRRPDDRNCARAPTRCSARCPNTRRKA